MSKTTRWKQRFENFEKSFLLLKKTIRIEKLTEVERGGLIQFFEITFELSWKTLKDYLDAQGFSLNSPKEVIKQGFQMELIDDGHSFLEALENRNLTVHTYDESMSLKVEKLIRTKYFPMLRDLYQTLKNKK